MKVLFDTNIVLDVLLDRAPFADAAAALFSRAETGAITGYVCATTVTTVHYLAQRAAGRRKAQGNIEKILQLFEVAPVNRMVLESALQLKFSDFEDAVLHEAACHAGAQCIVTRDRSGFKKARLSIYTPDELLSILAE